jgi:TrmH family RNA methyltransferase
LTAVERISSRQNPLVKRFRDLARAGAGGEWMLLDGPHLVEEALTSGATLDVAAFSDRLIQGRLGTIAAKAQSSGARTVAVSDQVLAALSPVQQPSGVVAIARRREVSLDQVLVRKPSLLLLLHEVQDPGNVGAIIRAAEGCGATGVVTGDATADPFGWKALRGAMGSTLRLPVASKASLQQVIERARADRLRVFAAIPRGGTPLPDCDLRGSAAILLGGEGSGLPQALFDAADERMTVPMKPPVESLNVAIAAALILYEASRQRLPFDSPDRSVRGG